MVPVSEDKSRWIQKLRMLQVYCWKPLPSKVTGNTSLCDSDL
jgi:hypothetical protein